jgi:hypothetical protein
MTETTPLQQENDDEAGTPTHPSDILITSVVALLAPMFLGASNGDVGHARMATIEMLNAYQIRNHAELLMVAQIVGFGLAALGCLGLSMADDIPLAMTLRLRGGANALNRSAEHNRRALEKGQADSARPQRHPAAPDKATRLTPVHEPIDEVALIASVAAAKQAAAEAQARMRHVHHPAPAATPTPVAMPAAPANMTIDQQRQAAWAAAMAEVASEYTASLATLPPEQRMEASMRAAVLTRTATTLLSGASAPSPMSAIRAAAIRPNRA